MEPTYSIPSTPLKTPMRNPIGGFNSICKPTPEQNAFNLQMFSEKKKNAYQTPKCPSPPLKSTPASRLINSNKPLIHHISSLSMFSPPNSISDFIDSSNNSNNIDFSSSFGSSLNSNSNGGYKIPNSNNSNSSNSSSSNNTNISLFDKNFEIISKLGSGSFSDVFKVKSKFDGNYYAIKQARHQFRGYQERDRAVREVKTAVSLPPHPNVLQYYSSWEQNNTLFIQTELCENASLQDFLDSLSPDTILSEELIWNFLFDISLGIQHIHSYNMLHLDIKPENLFISGNGNLKIGDFGMAVKLESNSNSSINGGSGCHSNNTSMDSDSNNLSLDEDDIFFDFLEGDSRYLAYEFLLDKKQISKPSDIFSIGVTFFEMVTGKEMPTNGPLWELLRCDKAIDFLEPGKYSDSLYQLILDMMKSNIQERITLDQILSNQNIQLIQQKRLECNNNNDQNNSYNLNLISQYFQYQEQQREQELREIKEFKDLREFKEKFQQQQQQQPAIPTPHFIRNTNSRKSSSSLFSDNDETDTDDDSGRDSPIHFSLNNNINNNNNNSGNSYSIFDEISNNNNMNNISSSSGSGNENSISNERSPLPSLSMSRKLSSSSLVSASPKYSEGFYGIPNNNAGTSSNNLLNSSGEFASKKKLTGKRGLPLLDINGNGSGSKISAIKRSYESLPENDNSPRNLLNLFKETN